MRPARPSPCRQHVPVARFDRRILHQRVGFVVRKMLLSGPLDRRLKTHTQQRPWAWWAAALLFCLGGLALWLGGKRPAADNATVAGHIHPESAEAHAACPACALDAAAPDFVPPDPVLAEFSAWVEHAYRPTSANGANAEQEGVALARARREVLKALIQRDPQAALAWRIPDHLRHRLPTDVQALLEEPVNAAATYEVAIACGLGEPGTTDAMERVASWDQRRLRVFTYGARLDVSTKHELSLVGIAVDDVMALYDTPARAWTPDEVAAAGEPVGTLVAEGLGKRRIFAQPADLEDWIAALQADELALGPGVARKDDEAAPSLQSSYTEGHKTLLYMVCDFPDLTGFSVTPGTLSNAMNTVTSFFHEASYGKVHITPTYVPGVLRLPKNGASYTNNFSSLLSDARAAALAAGYNTDAYDFYIVLTDENSSGINFSYAGKAWVGSKGLHLVEPYYTLRTAGHELGHNFGLRHANYWRTDSDQPIGRDRIPGGYVGDASNAEWIEYGHHFSLMSGQSATYMTPAAHFAPREKRYLDWITSAGVRTVTNSQTVRVYRFDERQAEQAPQAIHVDLPATDYTGNQREYWLGYRNAFRTNGWLMHGLQVDWAKPSYGSDGAVMLDMSPFSNDDASGSTYTDDPLDKHDGALLIGRTWSDQAAGIHITPLARGGTSPDEWLDVNIQIGTFPSNRPPVLSLEASATNAALNGLLAFSATASDADGDDLAYAWDFGRPTLLFSNSLNQSRVSNSWNVAGEYVVRCIASDMKGGRASASLVVRIGNPATYRISGRILENGRGVENVRVYLSHTNMTYTDSSGAYQLLNLAAASYTVGAQNKGALAVAAFNQPVTLGPSAYDRHLGFPQAATVVVDTAASPLEVAEAGPAASYVIRLGNRPTTNVSFALTWDTNQLALTSTPLVLTPNDWLLGRTVTVTAVDDALLESRPHTALVTHAASSLDPQYASRAVAPLAIHILDNETNLPPAAHINQPTADSRWVQRQDIATEVTAHDPDGAITQVCLQVNGTLVTRWTTPPFSIVLSGLTIGAHTLHAEVWDDRGCRSTSTLAGIEILCDLDADGVPDESDPDDDGDGLTDLYEQTHFGGVTNGLPHGDADEDGFSNYSEQIADTNPTNALSYFRLLLPASGRPDGLRIASAVGRFYTLQACTDLGAENTWSNVTGRVDIPGTGEMLDLTDPAPAATRWYRLWVTRPEE
jgi:hypothetical protein